jgi:oligopeptide transport system substrate-binding protein
MLFLLIATLIVSMAGCANQPSAEQSPTTVSQTPETTVAPAPVEASDRYLVWNLATEPKSWDPTTNSESIADYMVTQLFEGLTYTSIDGFEPGVA